MVSKEKDGITQNLSSLRFDTAVTRSERNLLFLRKRSYLSTIKFVSHSVYFVSILNEVKRRSEQMKYPDEKIRLNRIKIGFIGCGRLGTHIVKALLQYGNILPEDMVISTRRPESFLDDFKEMGITCCYDNEKVVETVDLAFLCCLPAQAEEMLSKIKGKVGCYLYSFMTGYSTVKLNQLLECDCTFKPEYEYNSNKATEGCSVNFNYGICEALSVSEFREITCPLSTDKDKGIVVLDQKFIEVLYYIALNISLNTGLSIEESFKTVNDVIFEQGFGEIDMDVVYDSRLFHDGRFNISCVNEYETFLQPILEDKNNSLYSAFRSQYKAVFDRFIDWRNK